MFHSSPGVGGRGPVKEPHGVSHRLVLHDCMEVGICGPQTGSQTEKVPVMSAPSPHVLLIAPQQRLPVRPSSISE